MKYLLAAFVLSFLIMVHELGHFIAGRLAGIPVDRFSVGFGPRLWGFVWRGTEIRLSAIPLGGYVLPRLQDEMEYFRLGLGKRLFFAMGGPAANILIAGMLFAAMNAAKGDITVYSVTVAPLLQLFDVTGQILASLLSVFSGDGRISSVLGIVATGGRFIENGFIQACTFTALMSLNLAVFNLLPLPPLDGAKMVMDLLSSLQPRLARAYIPACVCGWILFVGIFLYATFLDLQRLGSGMA